MLNLNKKERLYWNDEDEDINEEEDGEEETKQEKGELLVKKKLLHLLNKDGIYREWDRIE